METQNIKLDNLLDVLGNPTRRMILAKLAKLPHYASELANSLHISRQRIHSQLGELKKNNLIEPFNPDDNVKENKYRIKKNISVRIDITPDYYSINYSTTEIDDKASSLMFKDDEDTSTYENIHVPENKIKYLGERIREIESDINVLENARRNLLQSKECFIIELKNLMNQQYRERLSKIIGERRQKERLIKESLNLGEEIFFTLFFNPEKYFKKINVENLLDDLFFASTDLEIRARNRVSVEPLLKDLSKLMHFMREDKDEWFFDFSF
jgi:predicted transcriptional regulator